MPLGCQVPFGLDAAAEISGADESFLTHIMRATQAKIMLCGRGVREYEDAAGGLTVYIGGSELAHVRAAVDLIQDLLRAVREKCTSFVPSYSDAMKMATDTGVQLGRKVTKGLQDRAWNHHLDSMNRLTKLIQGHEQQLVQGQVDMKYLESSAEVFSHFQEVCRQSAEREAEMDRRLLSMQALVATLVPTIVQESMQEGMTPPQSMKFALSIVDGVKDIPQPALQPPPRARPPPPAPGAFDSDTRGRPPQPPPMYQQTHVAGAAAAYKRGRDDDNARPSWQPRGGASHGYHARPP